MESLGQVRDYLQELVLAYPLPLDPAWAFEIANQEGELALVVALSDLSSKLQ